MENEVGKRIRNIRQLRGYSQEGLAEIVGTTKQSIYKYETGLVSNIPLKKFRAIAKALDVSPEFLMGYTDEIKINFSPYTENKAIDKITNQVDISPIVQQTIPMLGEIACGIPRYVSEERASYVVAGTKIKADFALTCRGDSMTGARIQDGDIVFCRSQDLVENGEIAAVIINDEATLKRVYYYPQKQTLILQPANPAYESLIYSGEELTQVKIIGKAIAFQSDVK